MTFRFKIRGWLRAALAGAAATALALPLGAQADSGHPRAPQPSARAGHGLGPAADSADANQARVIIKYRLGAAMLHSPPERARQAVAMGRRLALPLQEGRSLGPRMQVLHGAGISSQALAARLAAQPDVEWAVVDQRRHARQAVPPNDPYFGNNQTSITPSAGQWYLRAPTSALVSATNAQAAWALTTGSPNLVVAVLDTGVRMDHPDLAGKLLPGYDFVRNSISGDGDGRDADANDPGDWANPSDTCWDPRGVGYNDSSWHGTQVAGLIGAATNNGIGIAGLAYQVKLLPVRVLGRCGGYDSDIIAAMLWAGGVAADPYANPYPARVLNMSLGDAGSCSAAYQEALAQLASAKVSVVVAAGNDAGKPVNAPANCAGAIAVSGLRHAGSKVGYSNIGPEVALAAPAGNCVNDTGACLYPLLTTINLGTTSPGANSYSDSWNASLGTSFATPLVAGTVALMLSVNPNLTPSQVKTLLQASARPFPSSGGSDANVRACQAPSHAVEQLECYCTASTCGAGMLDTAAAVQRVLSTALPSVVIAASNAKPTAGQSVSLDGRGSSSVSGRTITTWRWSLASGSGLASFMGATNGPSATLLTSGSGTVVVVLEVTDSAGQRDSSSYILSVQAASAGSGGSSGGGALSGVWLLGLATAVLALGRRPKPPSGITTRA